MVFTSVFASDILDRVNSVEQVIKTPGTYYDFGIPQRRQVKDFLGDRALPLINDVRRYWCSYSTPLAIDSIDVTPPSLTHIKNAVVVKDFQHVIVDNQCIADRFGSRYTFEKAMASHGRYFGYDSTIKCFNLRKNLEPIYHIPSNDPELESFILISNDVNDRCLTHWLLGKIPEIMLLRPYLESIKNPTLIFTYKPKKWQLDSLALALHPNLRFKVCVIEGSAFFANLIIPFGSDQPSLNKSTVDFFESISKGLRVDSPISSLPRKVYISRRDADTRRLLNEQSAIQVLMEYGYVPLVMTNYSLFEQIAIMANCESLIMIDGSHGCFGYFLRPNPNIGLIQSVSPGSSPWEMLFNVLGIQTETLSAQSQASSEGISINSDMTVCLDSIRHFCAKRK